MDLGLGSSSLSNIELLEKIGILSWIHHNDTQLTEKITAARVGYEVYRRMSGEEELDALRNQTIMRIAKFVKDNPKAKKEDIQKELAKQITNFARQVEKM